MENRVAERRADCWARPFTDGVDELLRGVQTAGASEGVDRVKPGAGIISGRDR